MEIVTLIKRFVVNSPYLGQTESCVMYQTTILKTLLNLFKLFYIQF